MGNSSHLFSPCLHVTLRGIHHTLRSRPAGGRDPLGFDRFDVVPDGAARRQRRGSISPDDLFKIAASREYSLLVLFYVV
ncbi:MAG: hypothetical protein ACK512_02330, partial [Cyanobium sp.]